MARKSHNNTRKNKARQENKNILIVTEDTESAYNYFKMLKTNIFRLPTLKVEVKPSKKSAPDQVVAFAKNKADEIESEMTFCIIDRDTHEHFDKAIKNANKIKNLEIIASYPCFEYWIILHHNKDCYKPMDSKICYNETIDKFKSYDKSMDNKLWLNFYNNELVSNQDTAIEKAISAEDKCMKNETVNPKTDIYKLFNTKGYPFYKDCK